MSTDTDQTLTKVKQEIQTCLKKKTTLYSICMALLDKNAELFYKHEQMLEEEREERQSLAVNFQD
jgi:hypothetical protein